MKLNYIPRGGLRGVVIVIVVVVVTVLSCAIVDITVVVIAVIATLRGNCHHYCKHYNLVITVLII